MAGEDQFPPMDDDLEAAFAKSVDELRSHQVVEEKERPTFEDQGQRGNIYRMVASALEDKSKNNNGKKNQYFKYIKMSSNVRKCDRVSVSFQQVASIQMMYERS